MISLPSAVGDAASAVCAARPEYAAHCAELPFIIIQLPQWIDRATAEAHADPLDWPVIRDAQWAASREIPDVATICTIDCGEFAGSDGVFHDAAARIVPDCAVHGGKTGLFSEPGTADSTASGTTGDTTHGTTGDTAGEGDGVIRVFSPDVPQPVAIRYAWKSWGPAPVRNADGLPGIPFCADVPQA